MTAVSVSAAVAMKVFKWFSCSPKRHFHQTRFAGSVDPLFKSFASSAILPRCAILGTKASAPWVKMLLFIGRKWRERHHLPRL